MSRIFVPFLVLTVLAGCQQTDDPDFSYYEERIGPTLANGCARSPAGSGCHIARDDGTALGNLDITSYDSLSRRYDVLTPFGPYNVSLLLLKAGEPIDISVETWDPTNRYVDITTDIRHNNGTTVERGSRGYAQLKQWMEAGHTRTGVPDETLSENRGECTHVDDAELASRHPLYTPGFSARFAASFARFNERVEPVLQRSCAGGSCHGSSIVDLFLTCGETDAERDWNFWVAVQHVTTPASTSGLLRRPLSTFRGGVFHEGGNVFSSAEDEDYQEIFGWADELVTTQPDAIAPPDAISEGLRFFANRVQPVLVRKGCMFLNCHSVSMFHDLRLQGGAQGVFSRVGTFRNYEASRALLAYDAANPNESRIIGKNLYPPELTAGSPGIFHRGGPLLEDFSTGGVLNGATPDDCAGFDADNGDLNEVPAYCILARWHAIERQEAIASGEIFADTEVVRSVAWISRPTGVGEPRDFDTYRGGADLMLAPATVDATTGDLSIAGGASVLGGCGLDPGTADLRGLAVSWDGSTLAFGARSSAGAPLRLYRMQSDGTGCERVPGVAPGADTENGILTHDFDPAFAPNGALVFASSRGNSNAGILGFSGPTRTPAAMQPNANLYSLDPGGEVRQLTFLLNQEMQPSFMSDGRIIFTAEKREPGFHQLAGRRQNLDGGDYHPLFAQRGSVGYGMATEIVEMFDRNLAIVAAPLDAADGAGMIAIANRSIGPDQSEPRPDGDNFYIGSQRFVTSRGAWRSPYPLPSGRLLVSCDQGAGSLQAGGFDFQLCELDVDSGAVREIGGAAGRADIEAVAVYARANRGTFVSRIDEANGHTYVEPGQTDADVEVVDFPLLATLLFSNTRTGRPIDHDVGGIDVYGEYPPPMGTTSFGAVSAQVVNDDFGMMFLDRRSLGHVSLNPDGSAHFRYCGGVPIVLGLTGWDGSPLPFGEGAPFTGDMIQREQMQFYPGERAHQSFRRQLFNGLCAGCHGSITNRELDVVVDIDVLTSASQAQSNGSDAESLALCP
ncbi:MAG: PD40 domain-containing protein [Sandaracinaceae bacterium]|nr:PD40 domain-containing protein [Sandaracinaceae bacterium]